MSYRYALGQSLHFLGLTGSCATNSGFSVQAARLISTSGFRLWPDVVVPPMGESIKQGSIAAVLKQVGQQVREDEVIAQIETDKVTIDIKAPIAGFLQQLHIKAADTVVPGQIVAVVGATTPAGGVASASTGNPESGTGAAASTSGRKHMIHFPPRFTASGVRISDLPEAEYAAALAAAEAVANASPSQAAAEEVQQAAPPAPVAPSYPLPAAKAAPPPVSKNKLQYITRPDGRGGPPRRPLTERELEMINLGGVY